MSSRLSFHEAASSPRLLVHRHSIRDTHIHLTKALLSDGRQSSRVVDIDAMSSNSHVVQLCTRCTHGTELASVLVSIPSSLLASCSPEEASSLLDTMTRLGAVVNAPVGTLDLIMKSLITRALEAQDESLTMAFTSTARILHSLSFIQGSQSLKRLLSSTSMPRALLNAIDDLPRKRGQSSRQLEGVSLLLQAFTRCKLKVESGELSDQMSNAVRIRLGSANASSLLSLAATISSAFSSPSSSLHNLIQPLTHSALLASASELSSDDAPQQSIGPGLVSLLVVAVRSKRSLPGLLRRLLALLSWHCIKSTSHGSTALSPRDLSMALWSLSRIQYRRVHQIRTSSNVDPASDQTTKSSRLLWGSLNKSRRLVLGRGRRGKKLDPESFLLRSAWSEWPEWTESLQSVSNSILSLQDTILAHPSETTAWDAYSLSRSLMSLSIMGAATKKNNLWMMLSPNALKAFNESQAITRQKGGFRSLGAKRFMLGEQQKRRMVKLYASKVAVSLLPSAIRLSRYDSWCLTTLFRSYNGLVELERLTEERTDDDTLIKSHRPLPHLSNQLLKRILAGGQKALEATAARQPSAMVWGSRQLVIVALSIFMTERKTTRPWAEAFAKALEARMSDEPVTRTAAGSLSLLHCCQGLLKPQVASKLVLSIPQDELGVKCLWQRQVLSLIQAVTDHGILHEPGVLPILLDIVRPRLQMISRSGGSLPFVIEHLCLSYGSDNVVLVKGQRMRQMFLLSVVNAISRASRIDQLVVLARGVSRHMHPGTVSTHEIQVLGDITREIKIMAGKLREMMREKKWSGQRKADEDMLLIDIELNRWLARVA